MDRRSFLLGTAALASQLLVGCGGKNQLTLNVQLLKGSIPGQVVDKFSKVQKKVQLKFAPVGQLEELFQQLQTWQKKTKATDEEGWLRIPFIKSEEKPTSADLVTLGDYWISAAIQQKLIQPLDEKKIEQWSTLVQTLEDYWIREKIEQPFIQPLYGTKSEKPNKWQELLTRNDQGLADPKGKVWAVPYRWGTTVIVYRRDKLNWTPTDWADLWRVERGRISMLNQPREVIGLVLKKLGKSYNTEENLDTIPELEKELRSLNQQVKFYDSTRYLEPLITGDTWLAVGWSNDVVPVIGRYPQLAAVIPQSGTALWADLWVSPLGRNIQPISYEWLNFCLTPDIAKEISLITKSHSPILTNIPVSDIQEPLRNLLAINSEVFDKSEFLRPLAPLAAAQYESLFSKIKG